jgi:ABC-2 type transport system ATP-binding protein
LIEVQDLTKAYGTVTAVDHVSFTVNKGEILGFLGPNGAGKTTTMRILTGYMPATSGTARIAGFDVFEDSMEVRRRIGYLPEAPPVYPDMSVESYLDFVLRIKNVPSEKRESRITEALGKTNLSDKRTTLIKRLSRGYKQRVGLAQALVHDPEVIVLDEPTVGLDPKQIIEVRHLIKNLAGSHTIILSTHILPEVSMTCDRVVIINKGKIAAVDTPENLTSQLRGGQRIRVEVQAQENSLRELLQQISGANRIDVQAARADGRVTAMVEAAAGKDIRSEVAARIVEKGWPLYELHGVSMSLEDIFLELTTDDASHAAEAAVGAAQASGGADA